MELLSNINILAGRQVCMCVRMCACVCKERGIDNWQRIFADETFET